ncbi:hypothetical protein LTR84_010675 [Exophiala bonariae]|uniref:Alpha/beta hydrolase fold-3 domain-containing protein n=1 Tax=Exophiala bonariae TaxID=1690606 RepID=A0AAV9MSU7_9EURO|nr:hypothetical protein LTR84_010675 [Exophiala bonariae]
MPLTIDPVYALATEPLIPILKSLPVAKVHDIETRRSSMNAIFGPISEEIQFPSGVIQERFTLKSYDSAEVSILHTYSSTQSRGNPTSAIIHAHGGGMIAGSPEIFAKFIARFASLHGLPVFSVDYRKAPESPHPAPTEDVYAGLLYVQSNSQRLNIDPARLILYGESAGGGIAAGVALMARDRHLIPAVAKQILIYPMLDDRNCRPIPSIEPFAFWNNESNITGWTALLGADKAGKPEADVSHYAAPARATDLVDLPRTYIDVGELDIFKAEDIEFARRLTEVDVSVEFHLYPGVPHAFETMAPGIWSSRLAVQNRVRALQDV